VTRPVKYKKGRRGINKRTDNRAGPEKRAGAGGLFVREASGEARFLDLSARGGGEGRDWRFELCASPARPTRHQSAGGIFA
jgi:hypothetical protein